MSEHENKEHIENSNTGGGLGIDGLMNDIENQETEANPTEKKKRKKIGIVITSVLMVLALILIVVKGCNSELEKNANKSLAKVAEQPNLSLEDIAEKIKQPTIDKKTQNTFVWEENTAETKVAEKKQGEVSLKLDKAPPSTKADTFLADDVSTKQKIEDIKKKLKKQEDTTPQIVDEEEIFVIKKPIQQNNREVIKTKDLINSYKEVITAETAIRIIEKKSQELVEKIKQTIVTFQNNEQLKNLPEKYREDILKKIILEDKKKLANLIKSKEIFQVLKRIENKDKREEKSIDEQIQDILGGVVNTDTIELTTEEFILD